MKTYRTGFLLALIGNIVLAVVLVGLWLHYRSNENWSQTRFAPRATSLWTKGGWHMSKCGFPAISKKCLLMPPTNTSEEDSRYSQFTARN